tara:strand:- start:3352 stop:3837 length:486 start_codon:yes stop_codon:yes gene_type:complete
MTTNNTTAKTERELGTIKADIAAMGHLFQKLDETMDSISKALTSNSAILAVHEERLVSNETTNRERVRTGEFAVKELHSRISTSTRENLEQHRNMSDSIKKTEDKILTAIQELRKEVNGDQRNLEKRIDKLEQWRWILIGALIAATIFFPQLGTVSEFFTG